MAAKVSFLVGAQPVGVGGGEVEEPVSVPADKAWREGMSRGGAGWGSSLGNRSPNRFRPLNESLPAPCSLCRQLLYPGRSPAILSERLG